MFLLGVLLLPTSIFVKLPSSNNLPVSPLIVSIDIRLSIINLSPSKSPLALIFPEAVMWLLTVRSPSTSNVEEATVLPIATLPVLSGLIVIGAVALKPD